MDVSLTGTAWSPINTYWPSLGEADVSFQMSGGPHNAQITNFDLKAGGQDFHFPLGSANYYLSSSDSGLAVFGPDNSIFVWYFEGPLWAAGSGGFRNEMTQIDFTINSVSIKNVSAPEPSILALCVIAAICFGVFYRVSKA